MPDAARIAQAQALEVPVILKGTKDAGDSGNAELFSEEATTVLVFDNGAVLNLRSRLAVGQTVFMHNTQNGREVLCKVMEAPGEGETGYTDLEFTTAEADFWNADAHSEAPSETQPAAAEPAPEEHVPSGSSDDPLAMMLQTASKIDVPSMTRPDKESGMPLKEELMATHEMAPDAAHAPHFPDPTAESFGLPSEPAPATAPTTESHSASEPTGDQIDAALKQMSAAPPKAEVSSPAAEYAEDDKHIAAMMERDARLAKFAAFKAKQAQGPKGAAAKEGAKGAAATPSTAHEAEEPKKPKIKGLELSFVDRLMSGKNRTYVAIGAGVLIAVLVVFLWQMLRGSFTHSSPQPAATVIPAQPKSSAPPAASGNANASTGTAQPSGAAPSSSVVVAETPETPEKPAPREERPASRSEARGDANDTGESEPTPTRHRRQSVASASGVEPAIVLSQPQPTLPPWAVGVEIDGVVTIDALIDEKGNVAETRVLSGPRALQREAERALGLWVFEPARMDGKAIPSHLTLSVQFLPPPPAKRLY